MSQSLVVVVPVKPNSMLKIERNWLRTASGSGIGADHPILKRKRVQRDLSQVIFGPTQ